MSAQAVSWSPDPSEMPGLLTKIPLRNKEYELFDKYREKEEVEDIKI
jgi:hypothetical protein